MFFIRVGRARREELNIERRNRGLAAYLASWCLDLSHLASAKWHIKLIASLELTYLTTPPCIYQG